MSNKGTVGIKDKGRVLELPSGNDAASGEAGLSPSGRSRIRFNSVLNRLELSTDGGAYVPITTGTTAAVWQQVGTTVSLIDATVDFVRVDVDEELLVVTTRPSVGDQSDYEIPGSFASLTVKDNATAQAGVTTAYVNIDAWSTNGASLRATPDQANNEVRITSGVWKVELSASVSAPAGTRLQVTVFANGVEQDISANAHIAGVDGSEDLSCFGTILAAGDTAVQAHIKSDVGGGVTLTVENAQLFVQRVA